jgi:hypothetical protein
MSWYGRSTCFRFDTKLAARRVRTHTTTTSICSDHVAYATPADERHEPVSVHLMYCMNSRLRAYLRVHSARVTANLLCAAKPNPFTAVSALMVMESW